MIAYVRTAWRLVSRIPGPWLVAVSLLGWALLIGRAGQAIDDPHRMLQHGVAHARHHGALDWAAMVLAMSPLLLRNEIAWLKRIHLPRRRGLGVALFLLGYSVPWLILGAAWAALPAGRVLAGSALIAAFVVLLAWHCGPARQRLLNACHRRPPVRAFGWVMVSDTARFGLRAGLLCAGVCGPGMLVIMALSEGHLPAMALASLWLTVERYLAPRLPAWRLPWSLRDRSPRWRSFSFINNPAAQFQ